MWRAPPAVGHQNGQLLDHANVRLHALVKAATLMTNTGEGCFQDSIWVPTLAWQSGARACSQCMHDGWQHLPPQVKAPLEQGNRQGGAERAYQVPDEAAGCCNTLHSLYTHAKMCQPWTKLLPEANTYWITSEMVNSSGNTRHRTNRRRLPDLTIALPPSCTSKEVA